MKDHSCRNCGLFLKLSLYTHTAGQCPRCHSEIIPLWYHKVMSYNRPWLIIESGQNCDEVLRNRLRIPFEPTTPFVDSSTWTEAQVMEALNLQIGLDLPRDWSKVYAPMYQEPEFGPVDFDRETVFRLSGGSEGVDPLHNALLVTFASIALAGGCTIDRAIRCADLVYYMATCRCVGMGERPHLPGQPRPKQPLEVIVEHEVRQRITVGDRHSEPWYLMDAVAFACMRFDLPHLSSSEFHMYGGRRHAAW